MFPGCMMTDNLLLILIGKRRTLDLGLVPMFEDVQCPLKKLRNGVASGLPPNYITGHMSS